MILLRIFLYLICIISAGWSILVFAGPPIIKRVISEYSDGAITPSGITVSPGLDVNISRLEFAFQNRTTGRSIEGFSRATKISWSIFGGKPFLELRFGPSVLENHATANSISIYTPSFQKIDWQNIPVVANVDVIALNNLVKMHSLTLAGNLDVETAIFSNINIDAEKVSAGAGGSSYSANVIRSRLNQLSLNRPINEQSFSSTFAVGDIIVSEPDLTVTEAIFDIVFTQDARNVKIDLQNLKFSEFGGLVENIKVDGSFNQFNVLRDLQIDFVGGVPFNQMPKFPEISARVKKLGDEQYLAHIEGTMEEFELSSVDNFIGSLPSGNFIVDLELDRAASKVVSASKISFDTVSAADITTNVEMEFRSEPFTKLKCALADCKFYDFDLAYKVNFDDEWVRGSAYCAKSFCGLAELEHLVRTSNTVNIFTILNQANILNPLSSLYLYGAISSGQKISSGHELKFQF